ncbi:MAG: hypothetical protein ACLR23_25550 [Clostridia bacterium]
MAAWWTVPLINLDRLFTMGIRLITLTLELRQLFWLSQFHLTR